MNAAQESPAHRPAAGPPPTRAALAAALLDAAARLVGKTATEDNPRAVLDGCGEVASKLRRLASAMGFEIDPAADRGPLAGERLSRAVHRPSPDLACGAVRRCCELMDHASFMDEFGGQETPLAARKAASETLGFLEALCVRRDGSLRAAAEAWDAAA